jgi:hypothetical protein
MKVGEKIIKRFKELIERGEKLGKPTSSRTPSFDTASTVQWKVSCTSFLINVFGEDNLYLKQFDENIKIIVREEVEKIWVGEPLSVIKAAKDDYENGYLFNTRTLIEAEIFDDLLEQSEHLLSQGYFQAAAVIAGCVLEDGLRKLCIKNNITLSAKPKMDSMNSELAKANVYNLLKQKQITALADLRNKAAHNKGGFTKEDVEDMIRNVRRFMEDYFS